MPVVQPLDQLEDEIPRNSKMPIFGCRISRAVTSTASAVFNSKALLRTATVASQDRLTVSATWG